jgi:hypothetical protein
VLIAAPDLLPALKERASSIGGEILAFSDSEALQALDVITRRRPHIVALERLFAATPRGAALINRIKADPGLNDSEIRVVAHDTDYTRVSPRRPGDSAVNATAAVAAAVAAVPAAPLDQRGTRRAKRFKVDGVVEVLVDGNQAVLIDLSAIGAQVVCLAVLKPNQRVRMALFDDRGTVRFNATVAWASFEIPPSSGPRYRAGIEFLDADARAVEAYCLRHKAP